MKHKEYMVFFVLTRTSGRPNYFARCAESVERQAISISEKEIDAEVVHIVGREEGRSSYVEDWMRKSVYDSSFTKILLAPYPVEKPSPEANFPWNLYMNHLHKEMVDDAISAKDEDNGWVIYLDDDDEFVDPEALCFLRNLIRNRRDTIYLWKVQFPGGLIIPRHCFGSTPTEADIASCGIAFPMHMAVSWDGQKCADYRAIMEIWHKAKRRVWIDDVFTGIQRKIGMGGFGQRDDKE